MAEATPTAQQTCSYKHGVWSCPLDAEEGKDKCIFHLPSAQKEGRDADFWQHLRAYLDVLFSRGPNDEVMRFWRDKLQWPGLRPVAERTRQLYVRFAELRQTWDFSGFDFPEMTGYSFRGFKLRDSDFTAARFRGKADFQGARFKDGVDFSFATFDGEALFEDAAFTGKASFRGTESAEDRLSFAGASFKGPVDFSYGTLRGEADFSRVTFTGPAVFSHRSFNGEALFYDAKFYGEADFSSWKPGHPTTSFKGRTTFHSARFGARLSFEGARFEGNETSFRDVKLLGPVLMRRTTVEGLLAFNFAELRNQLLFDGTILGEGSRILLWGLNFVHGISDVTIEKGRLAGRVAGPTVSLEEERRSGQIIEPAGQVVFRDIKTNMNHVSFLHTDVLTDRLLVRFSNVKWETHPRQFILDAKFAFVKHREWNRTKLAQVTACPTGLSTCCPSCSLWIGLTCRTSSAW